MSEIRFTCSELMNAADLVCPRFVMIKGIPFLAAPIGNPSGVVPEMLSENLPQVERIAYINSFNWIDLTDWVAGDARVEENGQNLQARLVECWQAASDRVSFNGKLRVRALGSEETGDWLGVAVEITGLGADIE